MEYQSDSTDQTIAFGAAFARKALIRGSVIALFGELGAGKTQFVKGIARACGIDEQDLTSPTFALANEYLCTLPSSDSSQRNDILFHLDCYRFEKPEELLELGIEDYLHPQQGATVIEWAERIEKFLPTNCIRVRINVVSETHREITISSSTLEKSELEKRELGKRELGKKDLEKSELENRRFSP